MHVLSFIIQRSKNLTFLDGPFQGPHVSISIRELDPASSIQFRSIYAVIEWKRVYYHMLLQAIRWQLLSGDLLEQDQAGFEPGAAGWKLPALPLSYCTTVLLFFV